MTDIDTFFRIYAMGARDGLNNKVDVVKAYSDYEAGQKSMKDLDDLERTEMEMLMEMLMEDDKSQEEALLEVKRI